MNKKIGIYLTVAAALLFLVGGAVGTSFYQKNKKSAASSSEGSALIEEAALPPPSLEELYPYMIQPRSTLSSVLGGLGVNHRTIFQIVEAAKPVSNLGSLMPGTRFQLFHADTESSDLVGIKFRFSALEMLEVKRGETGWVAEKITEEMESRVVTFSGVVTSSLWDSALQAQMDPSLISELAEVFAWQVDFSREVRVNDRWRISVEQKLVRGEPFGWGSILAAEYENAGTVYSAALLRVSGESLGYFAPDGSSLKRMFLKSPIQYGRISSRFQKKRFHPILAVNRPHLGVDYAAPTGTPVRAVGSGTVTMASTMGGAGKTIKIRHNSVYMTAYKHLNGYARGLRAGSRVQQGQVIGYVGSTGLSTGPHLHFEFFKNGQYVDPLGQKFPSADPVPANVLTQFQADATTLLKSLPEWSEIEERIPASTEL